MPIRNQGLNKYPPVQRKQYALKHRVISTIHAVMGNTLNKVAMHLTGTMFQRWDKAQIIVALTSTKVGIYIIFVGNKEETIDAIITLIQTRNQ